MSRPRKYPLWPGPGEKEVPYDTAHFIMWCVDGEGMTQRSAEMYVHHIRKAFEIICNEDYRIFEVLAQAFKRYGPYQKPCLERLEVASGLLDDIIEIMAQLDPNEFFKINGLDYQPKTLREWISAFSAYHRYFEYRIDKVRVELGLPSKSPDSRKDREIPLKEDFSTYQREECRYSSASVWSHVTYLNKLKYFFFDFALEEDVFAVIVEDDGDWESSLSIFKELEELIDIEVRMVEKDIPDRNSIGLTVSDLKRGKNALCKYRDFIKYRIKNNSMVQHKCKPD